MSLTSQSATTNYNTWCFGEVKLENIKRLFVISLVACTILTVLMSLISARYIPNHSAANWCVGLGLTAAALLVLNTLVTLNHHYDFLPHYPR